MNQIPDFTLVLGVDRVHLEQLSWTWWSWRKHKPSLMKKPLVIFYDEEQVKPDEIYDVVGTRKEGLTLYAWPPKGVSYERLLEGRMGDPQRYKMLSGFVHVPPKTVGTPYWLKIDTDVIATENDAWIDRKWFKQTPAIISHPWGFTKPADQMDFLDQWVEENEDGFEKYASQEVHLMNDWVHASSQGLPILSHFKPLEMHPLPGWERLRHKRIISWCAFFSSPFTRLVSGWAETICGQGKLPVPSQDGYLWYVAERMGLPMERPSMKKLGWEQRHSMKNVQDEVKKAMGLDPTRLEYRNSIYA